MHPAVFFIKYLITAGHEERSVEGILEPLNLLPISKNTYVELFLELKLPDPFKPSDLAHRPSQLFIRQEQIRDVWRKTPMFNKAYEFLAHPHRDEIESLLLSPLSFKEISKQIKKNRGTVIAPMILQLFAHYFWNRTVMSGSQWGSFLLDRKEARKDWMELAVEAQDPRGADLLLWKMGMSAREQIETNHMFTDMRDTAYRCFQQIARDRPGAKHAQALLGYTQVARQCQEQANTASNAVEDIVSSFNSFQMNLKSSKAKPVIELTGGSISSLPDQAESTEPIEEY